MEYLIVVAGETHYKVWDQDKLNIIFGDETDVENLMEWVNECGNSNEFIAVKTDISATYPDFIKAKTIDKVYIKEQ